MTGMALATNSAPLLVISWTSLVPSWACWCGCTPAKSFSPVSFLVWVHPAPVTTVTPYQADC